MIDPVFCFGRCEVHVGTRELHVDGQARALEPLAFNLLVYLLRHRDRAVSKDELLDQVWLGRTVSVGSLTRAVMMVRRAIEDAGEPPLIRTVHRVGYRFAGEVGERAAPRPAAPQQAAGTPITVALLPFENLTGDLSLDWTTLGLMALVGNALAIDARLAPMSVHALATRLRGLPHDADIAQRADALRRHDGVQHVVHTRILRGERGERGYRLDYQLVTAACASSDTVHADTPIRLGRVLARRLLSRLLPGEPSAADGFAVQDAWALEVFGRAMQASAEQNRVRAAHLLRVVLDMEPEYAEARLELQRVEAMGCDTQPAAAGGVLGAQACVIRVP